MLIWRVGTWEFTCVKICTIPFLYLIAGHLSACTWYVNLKEKDSLFNKWCYKLDNHTSENETRPLSFIIRKNKLKMDERTEHKTWNHKTKRKHSMLFDIGLSIVFLDILPQAGGTKAKINKWDCMKLYRYSKPSTKWKDSLPNGRRYLKIMYLIRG